MNVEDLKNVRKLKILKGLVSSENYELINNEFQYFMEPNSYRDSGHNIMYNIKKLNEVFEKKNFGDTIQIIDKIVIALNSRLFKVNCKKKWFELKPTKNENARFCLECSRHVFEVKNKLELRKRVHLQQCIYVNKDLFEEPINGLCTVDFEEEDFSSELGLPLGIDNSHKCDELLPFKKEKRCKNL